MSNHYYVFIEEPRFVMEAFHFPVNERQQKLYSLVLAILISEGKVDREHFRKEGHNQLINYIDSLVPWEIHDQIFSETRDSINRQIDIVSPVGPIRNYIHSFRGGYGFELILKSTEQNSRLRDKDLADLAMKH